MTAGQNELRMIWLISLVIVGISAWYLELQIVTYLTGLGFLISVMQYISAIEAPMRDLAAPTQVIMSANSKIPLYISSIIAIVGGVTELNWLMGIGITAWIFFLLRWLQRLERNIIQLQSRYRSADQTHPEITQPDIPLPIAAQASPDQSQLLDQIQQWIFRGNPVLKSCDRHFGNRNHFITSFCNRALAAELGGKIRTGRFICCCCDRIGLYPDR